MGKAQKTNHLQILKREYMVFLWNSSQLNSLVQFVIVAAYRLQTCGSVKKLQSLQDVKPHSICTCYLTVTDGIYVLNNVLVFSINYVGQTMDKQTRSQQRLTKSGRI